MYAVALSLLGNFTRPAMLRDNLELNSGLVKFPSKESAIAYMEAMLECEILVAVLTVMFALLAALPKMYPNTAAKAIRVAAMMRTVAMIGEIAFLRFPEIFIRLPRWPR